MEVITHDSFVKRARSVHGNKYGYNVTYTSMNSPITIECKAHGSFETTPSSHINARSTCPVCNKLNKELIKRKKHQDKINKNHGDQFSVIDWLDFSKVTDEVVVVCKDHGKYKTTFHSVHKSPHGGCPTCKSLKESYVFIKKAEKVHQGKYLYKPENYVCSRTHMTMFCKVHKCNFSQRPSAHLQGQGCPSCGKVDAIVNSRSSQEEFLLRCREVHGDSLDYSSMVYEGSGNPVTINCHTHGEFPITPRNLLSGTGCVKCKKEENRKLYEDKFLQKVKEDVRYSHLDFSKAKYVNNRTCVDIYCKDHKEWFKRTPNKILDSESAIGCNTCNKLSTNRWTIKSVLKVPNIQTKKGYLYTGSVSGLRGTKIGITGNITSRLATYRRDLAPYDKEFKFTQVKELSYVVCVIAETVLKKFYVKNRVVHDLDFGGKNEVYNIRNTKLLEDFCNGVWDEKLISLGETVDNSNHPDLISFVSELKQKEKYTNE